MNQDFDPFANQPSQNPYAAPTNPVQQPAGYAPGAPQPNNDGTMVWQVRLVAIFQIILGCIEMLAGLGCASLLFFMQIAGEMDNEDPEFIWVAMIIYGVIATVLLGLGALRLLSGLGCLSFKGRTLTFISLGAGLLSSLTCYCAPFSIGVGVYGLVVMLHPAVAQAFKMRAEGMSPDEIRSHFGLR